MPDADKQEFATLAQSTPVNPGSQTQWLLWQKPWPEHDEAQPVELEQSAPPQPTSHLRESSTLENVCSLYGRAGDGRTRARVDTHNGTALPTYRQVQPTT